MDLEKGFCKAAAAAFVEELAKHGYTADEAAAEEMFKAAGIMSSLAQGFTNFGRKASGFLKNEAGHFQAALGGRMASPTPSATLAFLPRDQAQSIKSGLGGAVDYAKGAIQRAAPNMSRKVQAALPAASSATASHLGDIAAETAGGSLAQGVQGYLQANHPVASALVGPGVGKAVGKGVEKATGLGGRVVGAIKRFLPGGQPMMQKAAEEAFWDELDRTTDFAHALLPFLKHAVSEEQAQKALQRYENLEKNKLTGSQVARYALVGGAAGPAAAALGNVIKGGRPQGVSLLSHLADAKTPGTGPALRSLAANAVKGAITAGAVPIVRHRLDRLAEKNTVKKYLKEQDLFPPEKTGGAHLRLPRTAWWRTQPKEQNKDKGEEKDSAATGITPAQPYAASESVGLALKTAAGAPTRGGFLMSSELPAYRHPQLKSPIQQQPQVIQEKMGGATTPAGRLAASRKVGLPKTTAPPGPSIADTVPTFGSRLPGANKTTIGKRPMPSFATEGGLQVGTQ